jgi:sugar lactone lactonase YvrE
MRIERVTMATRGLVTRALSGLAGAVMVAAALHTGQARAQIGPGLASEETVRAIMQKTTVHAEGLATPRGLLITPTGDMVVAEQGGGTIARIAADGKVTRIGGFRQPHDVAMDARGNLYVADTGNQRIAIVTPDRKVSTWVGDLKRPVDIVFNAAGELLVCEFTAKRVTAFASPQKRRVIVSGFQPHGLAIGADGSIYISDLTDHRIVHVGADGKIDTFAVDMAMSIGIVIGQSGDVYVAQRDAGKVVRLTTGGKKLTILDRLKSPRDPALDRDGNLYVAETATGRILKLAGRF